MNVKKIMVGVILVGLFGSLRAGDEDQAKVEQSREDKWPLCKLEDYRLSIEIKHYLKARVCHNPTLYNKARNLLEMLDNSPKRYALLREIQNFDRKKWEDTVKEARQVYAHLFVNSTWAFMKSMEKQHQALHGSSYRYSNEPQGPKWKVTSVLIDKCEQSSDSEDDESYNELRD